MDREFLLTVHDIPQVLLWMKRANRYFPMIEAKIKEKKLPEDLKYLAITESGLRVHARSHAGAVGLWQFVSRTGARYGLRRTQWVDERQDPVKSTGAALKYLGDLHRIFKDWFLAAMAYNVGDGRIKKERRWQRVDSYFDLVLPPETERYLFRIASAKIILADPEKYGFNLVPDDLYKPFNANPLRAKVLARRLRLASLAKACEMPYNSFKNMNPHFRRSYVPRGTYSLYLPQDKEQTAKVFIAKLNDGHAELAKKSSCKGRKKIVHRVRKGQHLYGLAKRYRVKMTSIIEWNQLESKVIHPGQRLTICK
jgi:hypothetical protein